MGSMDESTSSSSFFQTLQQSEKAAKARSTGNCDELSRIDGESPVAAATASATITTGANAEENSTRDLPPTSTDALHAAAGHTSTRESPTEGKKGLFSVCLPSDDSDSDSDSDDSSSG